MRWLELKGFLGAMTRIERVGEEIGVVEFLNKGERGLRAMSWNESVWRWERWKALDRG